MGRECVSPLPACAAMLAMVAMLCAPAGAQDSRPGGSTFEVRLPGGIRAAMATLDDRAAPDRSQFLLEVIRRFYSAPSTKNLGPRLAPLRSLVAHLDSATAAAPSDTLPLPLPPALWIQHVFGGGATPDTLASAILRSRNASLLYCALLSLDDDTREWLASKPDLVASLATAHTAAFLVAAPALRVRAGRLNLPGGDAARSAWLAVAGAKTDEPAELTRRIVEARNGRVAYFLGAMSQLSPAQVSFALKLDSADDDRLDAARRLAGVFEHLARSWDMDGRPFLRPPFDPALLLAELPVDERGRPILQGTRDFWNDVFADSAPDRRSEPRDGTSAGGAAASLDFAWLSERVFARPARLRPPDYDVVLFAARHGEWMTPGAQPDTLEALRAAWQYPALTTALERASVLDVAAFAAASRRAANLQTIRDATHAVRALLQFQGALALITRAAVRGGVPPALASRMVTSLAGVEVSKAGDYEGRLVTWLENNLLPGQAGEDALEPRLLQMLSGAPDVNPRFVDWEGTRYRLDLSTAEAMRLRRLLGDEDRPFISSARELVRIAESLAGRGTNPSALQAAVTAFAQVGAHIGNALQGDDARLYREIADKLPRAARSADPGAAAKLAPVLRMFADGLLARGLLELAYAAAMGQPGAAPISAREAAMRHDFRLSMRIPSTWELPQAGAGPNDWHVTGSLLGLDVRLAAFSLTRVSLRPPPRRPSLDDFDRHTFTEAVGLIQPSALSDTTRDAIVAALRKGRERVASARSRPDVEALADEVPLGPVRRTLLAWAIAHESESAGASFSLAELRRLGAGPSSRSSAGQFDAWGAPAESRLGCLCLSLGDRHPWEMLAGRWSTGIFTSGFPDLNLRLTELLEELRMPAALLGPVLAAATVDFVENASSRDPDDRRGPLEFVRALRRERVEEYLALLTTDGPLVPVGEVADPGPSARHPR